MSAALITRTIFRRGADGSRRLIRVCGSALLLKKKADISVYSHGLSIGPEEGVRFDCGPEKMIKR